ncbi:hypothetical protein JKF63_03392 [Porcisia hertigi]|uniref:Uncharacterized protein n=1 Tax=Porcisia hertigi TaxID=2761500 RepID=A0A836L9A6_9TRYP|nr:hypothetical protein JKF63_03392 [Porcisia hertigi]
MSTAVPDSTTHAALSPAYRAVSPRGSKSSIVSQSVSASLCPRPAYTRLADVGMNAGGNTSLASGAAALATNVIRGLRGSIGRDTVRSTPYFPPAVQPSAVAPSGTTRLLLPRTGGPLPLPGTGMAAPSTTVVPSSSSSAVCTTVASVPMAEDASLRKPRAVSFSDTVSLRNTVSTNTEAHTAFEEELVRELNELRRAPAAYATIVEQEATVGAPYVRESDLYFSDENAAENAAVELRRHLEERFSPAQSEAASVVGSSSTFRSSTGAVSPKKGTQGSQEKRRLKGASGLSCSPAASPGASAGSSARRRISRPLLSERHSVYTAGSHGKGASLPRRETALSELPGPGETVAGAPPLKKSPATLHSCGLRELTLSQLRHQFRCQQRYRAALEVALRDMRAAQQHAEAAQQAAWAAEDEKAMRKGRRFLSANSPHPSVTTLPSIAQNNNTGEPNALGTGQHTTKKLSFPGGAYSTHTSSGAPDDAVSLRRSEEMMQLRKMHESRIQHMEQELCDVRNACQRSLAAANLVLDAVRALQDAQPAPLIQRHRGLSLAARDTAEAYYSDEERVVALQELYSVSRATLVGLAEQSGGSTVTPATLERLALRLEERQGEEVSAKVTSPTASLSVRGRTKADESNARERTGANAVPSWVLPLLSEEASLLANVAQSACATYGYISGEVRGLHLQVKEGSPRSLMLQMIIGSLTTVLNLSNRSLPSKNGQSAQRVAKNTAAHNTNATERYAGVRIEGRVYAAVGAPAAAPTGTSGDASCTDQSQLQAAAAPPRGSEQDIVDQVPAVWLSEEEGVLSAAEHKPSNARAGAATDTSHAQRVAAVAAQRLWPLLWTGAYTIGCGWQEVRGRRRVPTFAEACEGHRARSSVVAAGDGTPSLSPRQTPGVICTTLLFASGFEEYEVVRGCSNMSPAAARRVVQSTLSTERDTSTLNSSLSSSIANAVEARRAAVDVHSTLGVTLLTPTMHPIQIHACDPSCRALCVAVRVPYTSPGHPIALSSKHAGEDGRMCGGSHHNPWIRVVAQVTRQCELTPPYPTACADEVLAQRSPVDPSVWLVLVDTLSALQRHADAAVVPFTGSSGAVLNPNEMRAATSSATGTAVPLALHIYAKDMNDPLGEFEHVAFIRLQQYPQSRDATAFGVVTCASAAPATSGPSVLMAPEWRYLLKGLACEATLPPSTKTATGEAAPSQTAVQASVFSRAVSTTPTSASVGWPTLYEPLLGRDGVLLCPLSADLRESERCGDVPEAPEDVRKSVSGGNGSESVATQGRVIRVAVQLPVNCNERWWRRRLSMLRSLKTKLTGEILAEGDGQEVAEVAQLPKAEDVHPDQSSKPLEEECNAPITDGDPPSDDAGAAAKAASLGACDTPCETAATAAASPSIPIPQQLCMTPAETEVAADNSLLAAGVPSRKATSEEASKNKTKGDSKVSPKKSAAPAPAGGSKAKAQVSSPTTTDSSANASKRKVQILAKDDAGSMSSSTAAAAAVTGATGSVSAPTLQRGRTLSANTVPKLPESNALREYEAMRQRAAAASPVMSRGGSVQACLQPFLISLIDLREFSTRLQADLQVWEAHIARMRPILVGERDRLATEITKKKGRELLRLQHDHDDVKNELCMIESGVASLQQAATAAANALRTRERTQVLRRARLARIAAELSALESALPSLLIKDVDSKMEGTPSEREVAQSAAPRVALRFLNMAAGGPVGSGRNAALFSGSSPQKDVHTQKGGGPLDCSVLDGAVTPSHTMAGEVPLHPKASLVHGAIPLTSPLSPPEGTSAAEVYTAFCLIPPTFTGRAALYIDDEIAVTWLV